MLNFHILNHSKLQVLKDKLLSYVDCDTEKNCELCQPTPIPSHLNEFYKNEMFSAKNKPANYNLKKKTTKQINTKQNKKISKQIK